MSSIHSLRDGLRHATLLHARMQQDAGRSRRRVGGWNCEPRCEFIEWHFFSCNLARTAHRPYSQLQLDCQQSATGITWRQRQAEIGGSDFSDDRPGFPTRLPWDSLERETTCSRGGRLPMASSSVERRFPCVISFAGAIGSFVMPCLRPWPVHRPHSRRRACTAHPRQPAASRQTPDDG